MSFRVSHEGGPLDVFTLRDDEADSECSIAAARGAIAFAWSTGGAEHFYLDRATLDDATKNVRGGNPVLFPSPGKLTDDAWAWHGARGAMKQHGFARNLVFVARETTTDDAARLVLGAAATDATRAAYPWELDLELTYALQAAALRIEIAVTNRAGTPMPFGLGFHPYFSVADKRTARIDTRATRAFDNVAKRDVAFEGFDFTAGEVDVHLDDHGSTAGALRLATGTVHVDASPEFTQWVVWTLPGRDFICLEPWTAPGDALNRDERVLVAEPGMTRRLWIELRYEPRTG